MTERPAADLDAFEARLLSELRTVVTEQATSSPPVPLAPLPSTSEGNHRRRPAHVVLVGAAAAAVVGIAVVGTVVQPTPAYAVTGTNGEQVTVRVMRLEGADALEKALLERGINADITYLPPGKGCAPGRYTDVSGAGLTAGGSAGEFMVTIPPGAVGRGNTFVVSASVEPLENGARQLLDFGVAAGPVAPCTVVDAS